MAVILSRTRTRKAVTVSAWVYVHPYELLYEETEIQLVKNYKLPHSRALLFPSLPPLLHDAWHTAGIQYA